MRIVIQKYAYVTIMQTPYFYEHRVRLRYSNKKIYNLSNLLKIVIKKNL